MCSVRYKNYMIIAIDFDDTVAVSQYPTIVAMMPGAKKYINKLYDDGHYVIIWTCRMGGPLDMAIKWLNDNGIKYHKVNEHHPELVERYQNDTRKIAADIYVDDKNILGLPKWPIVYKIITTKQALVNSTKTHQFLNQELLKD